MLSLKDFEYSRGKHQTLTFTSVAPLTPKDTMLFFNVGPTQHYVLAPLSIGLANPEQGKSVSQGNSDTKKPLETMNCFPQRASWIHTKTHCFVQQISQLQVLLSRKTNLLTRSAH